MQNNQIFRHKPKRNDYLGQYIFEYLRHIICFLQITK